MKTSKMVIAIASASILSVLMAISLVAASIAYFPEAQVNTVTTTVSTTSGFQGTDCHALLKIPPALNLPPNSILGSNDTRVISGTAYWYVSFVLGNLTTVSFHGVKFSFNRGLGPSILGSHGEIRNATMLTLSAVAYNNSNSGPVGCSTGYYLPQITITFSTGSTSVFNKETVKVSMTPTYATIFTTFEKPLTNPWFTQQISPRAGVGYQTDGGQITLYVSKS